MIVRGPERWARKYFLHEKPKAKREFTDCLLGMTGDSIGRKFRVQANLGEHLIKKERLSNRDFPA
jgi:hypothetical protein